ncbi:gp25 putative head protein [Iodobacter phage PhiPLPE]|uniref:Gp25 putative head protein n=1 Tax=Iodobacter phage PhiPLPE TaxID=551895 RepID=B5AX44_9CAUD|nr:head protein [Iodobacter phage PhiPLPE]ACG60347.1 gp25 putative head protein [Iodobacter phage PhiPLPE]
MNTLLESQLEQIATRKRKPRPVRPSITTESRYNAELQRIVRAVRADIDAALIPMIKALERDYIADSWVDVISGGFRSLLAKWNSEQYRVLANRLASQFVQAANTKNDRKFKNSLGIEVQGLGVNIYGGSPELQDYLAASAYDNALLIKSIPAQYLGQVESLVMTNMRAGLRPSAITRQLQQQFGITQRRAKFIARDQTSKINGDLNEKRQKAIGGEYFQWLSSDDERVRHNHRVIANRVTAYGKGIYRWDNLPLSEKGEPIKPGSDYNCRCVGVMVSAAQVEENKKQGRTAPGVKR